jgi:hypothetical protein
MIQFGLRFYDLEREMNTHRKEEDVENENDDSVREMMIV